MEKRERERERERGGGGGLGRVFEASIFNTPILGARCSAQKRKTGRN